MAMDHTNVLPMYVCHSGTDKETDDLIELRIKHDSAFIGSHGNVRKGWL